RINSDYTVVKKEYRRQGINTKVKDYLEDITKANYIGMITASVREQNHNSLNSLLKCGFVISKRKYKYKNGDIKLRLFKNLTY
ncbi:MAG: GNAT family N-acetyltransferase, partial [bacterium]